MSGSICSKRYVIGVVRVPNSLCGVSFASFGCQSETVFFHEIYKRSKRVV